MMLLILGLVQGFQAPSVSAPTTALNAMSKAIPFLTAPKGLDGYIGNEEFDPLGLAELFDIKFMREAEIKHGRVAMLATVGFVLPEFGVRFPGAPADIYGHTNPIKAATAVPPSAWASLIVLSGIIEWFSYGGKVTYADMFEDGKVPGEFGFDPLGYLTPDTTEELKIKELTHCRAAMIAIGGMIHGAFVTGTGVFGSTG